MWPWGWPGLAISPQVIWGGPWWAWAPPVLTRPFAPFAPWPTTFPVPVPFKPGRHRREEPRPTHARAVARMQPRPPERPEWGELWFNDVLRQLFIFDGARRRWEPAAAPEAPLTGGPYVRQHARWVDPPYTTALGDRPPHPGYDGQLWFDGTQLRIFHQGQWRPLLEGGSEVHVGVRPPANAWPGQLWFDARTTQLYLRYDDGDSVQWVVVVNQRFPDAKVEVSDIPPHNPSPGDLWFDSVSTTLFVYYADQDSQQWVVVTNPDVGAQQPGGQYWDTGLRWDSGLRWDDRTAPAPAPAATNPGIPQVINPTAISGSNARQASLPPSNPQPGTRWRDPASGKTFAWQVLEE